MPLFRRSDGDPIVDLSPLRRIMLENPSKHVSVGGDTSRWQNPAGVLQREEA
jgi:hypothetical protein